jgi:hypothetical protein
MVTIQNMSDEPIEGESLLDALDCARVLNVSKSEEGGFIFEEACDGHFRVKLTRQQVLDLADELRALAG